MPRFPRFVIAVLCMFPATLVAAEPVDLSEATYKPDLGVILVQLNWGRTWKCGQYDNAQLQAFGFTRSPIDASKQITLEFETPSKLYVDNQFQSFAYVIRPGEYVLTSFDVKIARSMSDISHIKGALGNLIKDGVPLGGSFTINPGEVIYIGSFGLDCGAEPFFWRYYIDGREEFELYVDGFRKKFPFLKEVPVQYRLFYTQTLGAPHALQDPVVK